MSNLAIIIPAYKSTFLDKALASIAAQTCGDFTLYVGDDASPNDLYSIVKDYEQKIDIRYRRFEQNLGRRDLIAQWKRCIALSQGEEWLWLFADDDEMEPECVEKFHRTLAEHGANHFDIYHFDIEIIDGKSNVLTAPHRYPEVIGSFDFYRDKLLGKLKSFVVENVFSREIYDSTGGFVHFDLAWGSDTATWAKFARRKGIFTISGAKIRWRESAENITPSLDPKILARKMKAWELLYDWSRSFFSERKTVLSYVNCKSVIRNMSFFYRYLPLREVRETVGRMVGNHGLKWLKYPLLTWIRLRNKRIITE